MGGSTATRGIRTVVLSVVALIGLGAIAVLVLLNSVGQTNPTPMSVGEGGGRTDPGSGPAVALGPGLSGSVSIAEELRGRTSEGGTLFIIARKGAGPPFAVKRIAAARFPLTYHLGPEDVMVAGNAFEGEMSISARLSKSGSAGPAQPGDLEGDHAGAVEVGARSVDVDIVLSRIH